jgi:hypothetical protein
MKYATQTSMLIHVEGLSLVSDSPTTSSYTVQTAVIAMKAPLPSIQHSHLSLLTFCHLALQV